MIKMEHLPNHLKEKDNFGREQITLLYFHLQAIATKKKEASHLAKKRGSDSLFAVALLE